MFIVYSPNQFHRFAERIPFGRRLPHGHGRGPQMQEIITIHVLYVILYIPVSSKGPVFQPDLKYQPAAETENSGGK